VGPEHAYYESVGRIEYAAATDEEALAAFRLLCRLEGLLPALESAHAVAHLDRLLPGLGDGDLVLVNLSGRGDKDVEEVRRQEGPEL
jgi:tryptophan synthase beta chain